MTTSDFLTVLVKLNIAAGAGIVLVMLLRSAARRLMGPRLAYTLWLVVPAAMLACLAPPRTHLIEPQNPIVAAAPAPATVIGPARLSQVAVAAEPAPAGFAPSPPVFVAAPKAADPWALLLAAWLAGCGLSAAWFARKQGQFMQIVRAGRGGPAVVGVFRPWIVIPDDFAAQFSPREQAVILAHETTHIVRGDSRVNGLVAALRCLCWFNPLIHIGAFEMRVDQELACDAQVLETHPKSRHLYAVAMLKAEGSDRALPLGCYWPAGTRHPLMERIGMLKLQPPSMRRRLVGAAAILAAASMSALSAWAIQPPRVVEAAPAPRVVQAAPAANPTDPLAHLAQDVSVIFDIGTPRPRLMLQETDHGVASNVVLGLGEEYRDGWTLSGVTDKTVTLTKAAQSRTITLTGKVQVATSAKPAAAPAPVAAAGAAPAPAKTLAQALASGNIADIVKAGGTAQDLARMLVAKGANVDPKSAGYFQAAGGGVGLAMRSNTGATYILQSSDYASLPAGDLTGWLDMLRDAAVANGETLPLNLTPDPRPAGSLAEAIATGNITQIIRQGGTAPDVAQVLLASGMGVGGAPIDPRTAVYVQAPIGGIGIAMHATDGSNMTFFSSDLNPIAGLYPPGTLPGAREVFGLPPLDPSAPLQMGTVVAVPESALPR